MNRQREGTPVPGSNPSSTRLLEVIGLKKYFPIERGFRRRVVGHVKAVDDVTLHVEAGESLGLVGESGCGKTTLGRCVVRAMQPTEGSIHFRLPDGGDVDLSRLSGSELRNVRRHVHMIFQDPFSSLDPRMTVFDIIAEPLRWHRIASGADLRARVRDLMSVVGLDASLLGRYPHAFSGGQRQRIGIARSLAVNPRLIVCDESVSALDVSVQAQILNLLQDLQSEFNLTYLFISHDLSVVEYVSDRVAVMYVGRLVEVGATAELYARPMHPYSEALLSAAPKINPRVKPKRIILPGEVANPANPPSGCPFHPRCRYAEPVCSLEVPRLEEKAPGRFVACHLADRLSLVGTTTAT